MNPELLPQYMLWVTLLNGVISSIVAIICSIITTKATAKIEIQKQKPLLLPDIDLFFLGCDFSRYHNSYIYEPEQNEFSFQLNKDSPQNCLVFDYGDYLNIPFDEILSYHNSVISFKTRLEKLGIDYIESIQQRYRMLFNIISDSGEEKILIDSITCATVELNILLAQLDYQKSISLKLGYWYVCAFYEIDKLTKRKKTQDWNTLDIDKIRFILKQSDEKWMLLFGKKNRPLASTTASRLLDKIKNNVTFELNLQETLIDPLITEFSKLNSRIYNK